MRGCRHIALAGAAALMLASCGGDQGPAADFFVSSGPNAQMDAMQAFEQAQDGDTIFFSCGFFAMSETLRLNDVDDVTIQGCGKNRTVISFRGSGQPTGLLTVRTDGIEIRDLTVSDVPGDAIRVENSDGVRIIDTRAMWSTADGSAELTRQTLRTIDPDNFKEALKINCPDFGESFPYTLSDEHGRYGIYPTDSENVLIASSSSVGSSDAGIYVGQTEDSIVRGSRAAYNVGGLEIENTNRADVFDNVAECNTLGILIFNLENRPFYGDQIRVFDNQVRNNNFPNVATEGPAIITQAERGNGILLFAVDRVELFDNEIRDHVLSSVSLIASTLLQDLSNIENKLDPWTEGIHIHDNVMRNGGNNPDTSRPLSTAIANNNDGTGAHVIWQGETDSLNSDCSKSDLGFGRKFAQGFFDDWGQPQFRTRTDEPPCRYNAWKFDDQGNRKKPKAWICIEDNDTDAQQQQAPLFFNLQNSVGESDPDNDVTPHRCTERFDETLAPLPEARLEFD